MPFPKKVPLVRSDDIYACYDVRKRGGMYYTIRRVRSCLRYHVYLVDARRSPTCDCGF